MSNNVKLQNKAISNLITEMIKKKTVKSVENYIFVSINNEHCQISTLVIFLQLSHFSILSPVQNQ